MLDKALTQRITDFVRQRPRTVQEIAFLIDRNWRTAERYIEQISTENGTIGTRTFREGTRGALKVVYWNALEPGKGSAYQERLLRQIEAGRAKTDFSPLDIYQFVPEDRREAVVRSKEATGKGDHAYAIIIAKAQRQVLLFSGNLSWSGAGPDIRPALEAAARRGVVVRILTRLDMTSMENAQALLGINTRVGRDVIEIRHCEQPLRGAIVDDERMSLKEVLTPGKARELAKDVYLYYQMTDPEWIAWTQKVFWHLWNQSVNADMRIDALRTVKGI